MSKKTETADDPFVKVWFGDEEKETGMGHTPKGNFYSNWVEQSSAKFSSPEVYSANMLRKLHPNHSLVMTSDYKINPLGLPGVYAVPINDNQIISDLFYESFARCSPIPGVFVDQISFGSFTVSWDKYEYIVHIAKYSSGFSTTVLTFVLHDGPEEPIRTFLLACGAWQNELHNEIWVFNQGSWDKDAKLWSEVQKADWEHIILRPDFKKTLQKDVYGFFESESVYKELAIPWKRGLIMHGPPGNGKTICIKAIMKTCDELGFKPLYVKSFQGWQGEEGSMQDVFSKAREMSPCVLVLEDLDSLINDQNRSFFLNELDGLESNGGILVIGTTNHFDRLDPGLSTRPSRFDRKFLFGDPEEDERLLYVQYWQKKLEHNQEISFPDELAISIAEATPQFSFAYLKEAFVSSLVLIATWEGENKPSFQDTIMKQIKTLRKQLDKNFETDFTERTLLDRMRDRLPNPQQQRSPPSNQFSTNQQKYRIGVPPREGNAWHRFFNGSFSSGSTSNERIFRAGPSSSPSTTRSLPGSYDLDILNTRSRESSVQNLGRPSKAMEEFDNAFRDFCRVTQLPN